MMSDLEREHIRAELWQDHNGWTWKCALAGG